MMRNGLVKIAARAAWGAGTGVIAYTLFFRRRCLTWGATTEEVSRKLPGDELLPEADIVSTRARRCPSVCSTCWSWNPAA
jgi:hypothetical protein